MKTEVLTVKRELPAMRCEICHQADCFTPETNFCTRCVGISAPLVAIGNFADLPTLPVPRFTLFEDFTEEEVRIRLRALALVSVLGAFVGVSDLRVITQVAPLLEAFLFLSLLVGIFAYGMVRTKGIYFSITNMMLCGLVFCLFLACFSNFLLLVLAAFVIGMMLLIYRVADSVE